MVSSEKPEDTPRKKGVHKWDYHPVPNKANGRGWKAGDPFGAWVHYEHKKSHVCAEKMSKKALPCAWCSRGIIPDWRGYVPWYDEQYTRRFSLITYPYYESVCEIPHLAHIVLRRGVKQTEPVVITAEAWTPKPIPYSSVRAEVVCLGQFLVHVLWGNEALTKWDLEQERRKTFNDFVVPSADVQVQLEAGVSPMYAAATARAEEMDRQTRNADFINRVRTSDVNQNGNGKKKPH